MNEESNLADDTSETDGSAETTETPRAKWARRITRRRALAAGGMIAAAVAGWYLTTAEDVDDTLPPPPPATAAERFDELFAELQTSDESAVRIDEFKIDDEMLRKLTSIERLTTIQVDTESISQETIARIARMPMLEQLHLRGAEINDAMLAELATSPTIWLLNLSNADVSPKAIEGLSQMAALRQLRLAIKLGHNSQARAVSSLTKLRAVHLIGIYVSDEGLQLLARMPQLESLYLDDTAITESGWTWLFENHPQLHVHINQKHHDRDPRKH